MKPLVRGATTALGLLAALGATEMSTLEAQRRPVAPPADAPRFPVLPFRSADKMAALDAADAIRTRLSSVYRIRDMYVIPRTDVEAILKGSGFDPHEAPDPITARLLAAQLRGDEYLEGSLTKTASGYRLDTRMVLTRDNTMVQPLPPAESDNVGAAARAVVASIQEARKQLDEVRTCENALREGNHAAAIAAARAGITEFPQATMARVCLARTFIAQKAPADSVIPVLEGVLAVDSTNRPALELLGVAYKSANQIDKAVATWGRLIRYYSTDPKLVQEVVNEIAASGRPEIAKPIIEQAVEQNPGDPSLTQLLFLIQLASKDWKGATKTGEDLARVDTARADTTFFLRLAVAYDSDSQPKKAAETLQRGVQKFPSNAALWATYAQMLRSAGDVQQSLTAIDRALSIDPKVEHGWFRRAQTQVELGQLDSAFASAKRAVQNGEDRNLVGQLMLVEANKKFRAARQTQTRADYQEAVRLLSQADSIAPNPTISFLLGASAFSVGDQAARENQKAKSCELAQLAEDSFTTAMIHLPKGAVVQQEAATQLLQAIPQYSRAVEGQKKNYCKSGRRSG
ncbi:MAG TPA: tetratricopeptide repeat protein [Gemmatimonadaceae bacterium]|nr:tetratricopeptide repeat protein [Gemmatimonadaceae bacterium]